MPAGQVRLGFAGMGLWGWLDQLRSGEPAKGVIPVRPALMAESSSTGAEARAAHGPTLETHRRAEGEGSARPHELRRAVANRGSGEGGFSKGSGISRCRSGCRPVVGGGSILNGFPSAPRLRRNLLWQDFSPVVGRTISRARRILGGDRTKNSISCGFDILLDTLREVVAHEVVWSYPSNR